MKRCMVLSMILFTSFIGYTQSYEGSVEFQKQMRPAAILDLPHPASIVDPAMDDLMSRKGRSRGSSVSGFTIYRNTQAVQEGSANADLYFKTERKGKRKDGITMVILLVDTVNIMGVADSLYQMGMVDAITYLNELALRIKAFSTEVGIKEQNEVIIKAEAKYNSLLNDAKDLEKERSSLEEKIKRNKDEQTQQLNEVERQKKLLTHWVGKRQ